MSSTDALSECANNTDFEFLTEGGAVRFRIDGVEPGLELRTEEINSFVGPVATVPDVRKKVVSSLRKMRELGNIVIEGRDITTVVFPDARLKCYLDASPEERARRRHREMSEVEDIGEEAVRDSLQKRDEIDRTREADPLRVADDAEVIDTTGMSVDQVVDHILGKAGQ